MIGDASLGGGSRISLDRQVDLSLTRESDSAERSIGRIGSVLTRVLQRELHRQAQICAAVLCVLKYLNPEPLAAALPCRPARRVAHEGLLYPQGATVGAMEGLA